MTTKQLQALAKKKYPQDYLVVQKSFIEGYKLGYKHKRKINFSDSITIGCAYILADVLSKQYPDKAKAFKQAVNLLKKEMYL